MTLHLRVISEHRQLAGNESIAFGIGGGSIGRSADNDWVLPDPRRYVSAHHARVHFRDGHYYLEDISTNGVYVNDEAEPLAKRGSDGYLLRDGDVLRLGEYHVRVSLEGSLSGDSAMMPSRIVALHSLGPAQADIGAVFDLEDLLAEDSSGGALEAAAPDPQPLVPAWSESRFPIQQAESASSAPPPATPQAPPSAVRMRRNGPTEDTVAKRMARLARLASHEHVDAGAISHDVSGLQAFCRGAGLKLGQLPAQTQELLHLAGRLLREALVGLKDVERTQEQIRDRLGVTLPPPDPDSGPSLGQSTVEELLLSLIRQHEEHSLDAVRWMRERHDEVKARERALAEALRTAFLEFLHRVDPAELEARFAGGRRGKVDPSQYWDLFTAFYRSLLGPADQLPHTFAESLAEAYKDALQPNTHDMPRGEHSGNTPGKRRS